MSGEDLARVLRRRYGYELVRQRGSHMTLTRSGDEESHSVTVPRHRALRVGTAARPLRLAHYERVGWVGGWLPGGGRLETGRYARGGGDGGTRVVASAVGVVRHGLARTPDRLTTNGVGKE